MINTEPGLSPTRTRPILGASIFLLVIALLAAGFALKPSGAGSELGILLSIVLVGLISGLLVAKRPLNPISWLLGVAAVSGGVAGLSSDTLPPGVTELNPWQTVLAILSAPAWYTFLLTMLVLIPMLFPNGTFLSRGWRWIGVAVVAPSMFLALLWMVQEEFCTEHGVNETCAVTVDNPIGVPGVTNPETSLLGDLLFIALPLGAVAAIVSLVLRYRRSGAVERQQLKWVAFSVGLFVAFTVFVEMILLGGDGEPDTPVYWTIQQLLWVAIPASIAIAILRYRLYEIDLVINRTVLFVVLAAFITVVYSVIVVGLSAVGTQGELVPSIVATAVIALAFEPVRLRAQRWADRVAYGKRATPYEVLSDLTRRLADTESAQGLLGRIARRLADGTAAERAGVWVWNGEGLVLAGRWPEGSWVSSVRSWEDLPGTVERVEADGERLGALSVEKRRGDAVTPTETRLMEDLAGSTAPVLQHLALQAELEASANELEASRRRLLDVQVVERRRLERDLDEGAQQLVVSLKVKLNVASRLARTEGVDRLAEMLEGMDHDAREAITQIRSLARGLYPQILEAEGLAAAVRSIAEFAPVPVEVEAVDIGRLPPELEATVFFCISEAITNAAKHAPGRQVFVNLGRSNGDLLFSVQDQGAGFDRKTVKAGSGLRNMADRLDAVGGLIEIDSEPGRGTRISGRVPLVDRSLLEVG